MLNCSYCDQPCQQTREHVIPDWYNDTPGDAETFSARAPLTHVKGDLIVKDVCGKCNSGVLSSLDGYGKELYDRYFAKPVYADETIEFNYDGDRLLRWLLKLSYNSARAQNADTRVLLEYRKVMLGESSLSARIRCWLRLVSPTWFDESSKEIRPARREEHGQPKVDEPLWFRIGQFRLPSYPALLLVQRVVLINSFAFTLLIARVDSEWPCPEFDGWIKVFSSAYPEARSILPAAGSVTISPGTDHTAASMSFSICSYPSRFTEEPNPYVEGVLRGGLEAFMLRIPHDLIEKADPAPIAEILNDMVSSREKAAAFKQRVSVIVDGFDDDPRGLWQCHNVREFFCRLFLKCPFVMFLSHPDGSLLKLVAACWLYEDGMTEEIEKERMVEFLNRAFNGLNGLQHTLALSEEQNREICNSAAKAIFGESPEDTALDGANE